MSAPAVLAPWLQAQLQAVLAQRGHAVLLAGPSGLGQYELALALARAWLCERPGPQGACGECTSCHAIDVRTHADLCVLMPETLCLTLGWPLGESEQREIDEKKRKPSRFIRVEAARQAVAFTQTTSARGGQQVVMVYPADRLNIEAANTLLKTLEEPAPGVRFVLATEAAHQLLPTIRSRCQTVQLGWPGAEEGMAWLQAQGGLNAAAAFAWWHASGGRPDMALTLSRSGLTPEQWLKLPQSLARGDWSALAEHPPAAQLDVLQKLCHDLMARAAGAPSRFFPQEHLPPPPPWRVLALWSRELLLAARSVEHPYQPGLLQEAWAARAREALNAARR
ncbi:MAG: DNA polymerase III subunit delta' [Hydrogenophaga sp.]|uniref:DNA polymerase III subunit delta n=1 Tax=Hydrogenophaga crocea TaxID=2716225 RepID=A0A6G8IGB1_9BURK|nr:MULTISPECIES: DNA polymerase III subunit delta' [Hydrogenophaga]MBL0946198.1 DNA polymerase III subunit delta' [Hydrogenophaga sp.]QIM52000.1 DNA polymerase III subunit delta' [Hydrogenophaga crocea]